MVGSGGVKQAYIFTPKFLCFLESFFVQLYKMKIQLKNHRITTARLVLASGGWWLEMPIIVFFPLYQDSLFV